MCAPPAPQQNVCLPRALHLDRLSDRGDQLARGREHVVVARQVAGVVVGDREARCRAAGCRRPSRTSSREQLGVVDHLVAAAEVRVLVGERVEAVRAVGDDLA